MIDPILFWQIDMPALLVATLAALCCAIPGNFLLLRRQAMLGDAFSHLALPGIVAAFLVVGHLAPVPMLLGALGACLLGAALIGLIGRVTGLEPGAVMGVVFTVMFAAGLVAMEMGGAGNVHIDADHVLFGNLESTLWPSVFEATDLLKRESWADLPRPAQTLLIGLPIIAALTLLLFKELKLLCFDEAQAAVMGRRPGLLSALLLGMTGMACVASFEAVGAILVIAMLICPAATARMLTDNLAVQVWLSALIAIVTAIAGYAAAAWLPLWLGFEGTLSAAGMIATMCGVAQLLAMLLAPRYGVLATRRRTAKLAQ
ncbi:MAG: metal ABC transporter permease [Alphaproteobacteria bacterium]